MRNVSVRMGHHMTNSLDNATVPLDGWEKHAMKVAAHIKNHNNLSFLSSSGIL